MDNFKKCSKCGEVKLLECFSRDKTRKDGYSVECKKCNTEYGAKYRAKNREKLNAKAAEYHAKNREKINARAAKYYVENAEKRESITAKYRAKNREKINARAAEYRAKNPEKRKSINAKYYVENAEKIKARTDKYTEQLTDTYIKNQIKQQTGVPYEHITQELIETKRLHILIQRKLKDLTK